MKDVRARNSASLGPCHPAGTPEVHYQPHRSGLAMSQNLRDQAGLVHRDPLRAVESWSGVASVHWKFKIARPRMVSYAGDCTMSEFSLQWGFGPGKAFYVMAADRCPVS